MLHTTLFEEYPNKFYICKHENGYVVFVKSAELFESVYTTLLNNPMYTNVNLFSLPDSEFEIGVYFEYVPGELDDYSETVPIDLDVLTKSFSSISSIKYVEKHLPYSSDCDTGDYYSICISDKQDINYLTQYMFERFGYIYLFSQSINNKTYLCFRNYEGYCYGKMQSR